jgi:soluble lytic murein transglycosylase
MLALGLAVLASLPPLVEGAVVSAELSELSRKLVASRSAANFSALQQYADSAAGIERHLAQYAIAMARYAAKDYGTAESALEGIPVGTAWLAEHAAYLRARCIVLAEDFERALGPLARFIGQYPDSRFRPRAERLQVESLLRLKRLQQARALLSKDANRLAEPVRLFLSGRVEHVDGNVQRAISLYRAAYYFYPFSDQAEAAEAHLNRLRTSMGKAYPAAPASRRLERAERLYEGRSYAKASAEYTRALNAGLAGTAREIALVRRGGTDYHRRRTPQAYAALARLRLNDPELNAERLYFLCALERRQGVVEPMLSSVDKLAKRHPRSPWYQEALLAVGNFYYLKDDRREYIRWFQRLEQAFPRGKHAPYAHWKVCWRAWLDDSRHRRQLLTDHIERFPGAPTAAGALYWMGRLHEEEILPSEAQGYYRAIVEAFPHYYYALLARQRLGTHDGGRVAAKVSAEIRSHLPDRRMLSGDPQEATRALLETGVALDALGFADDARASFHLVDYRQPDSHLAGLRLGRLHSRREEHFLALRAMKRFMFGYLRFPMESLDVEYWRFLFPLGWEDQLRARSERHDLDPYLVAALIRQESEFHPGARSRAGALGLMQIMPRTGRTLFRRLGIPGYSSRKLTVPDLSLRLGTFHLKEVLAKFDGELEKALAGYNAGENRITQWMELGPFEEAGEFVETIPLSETRGYVQAVLRNRAMYERLYGD